MDEDVTKLTDEELDKRLEEPEEVADEPDTTDDSADDTAQADEPDEEQTEEATTDETEEEEQKPPSRRETLRIQQILKKRAEAPQPSQPTRPDALDYGQALDADPEVIQQLEADRRANGQAQFNEGLKRAEFLDWKTSLKIDAPAIEKKFPILDKDSEQFHPAVADAVNTWYLNMSGFDSATGTVSNPNVSYAEFVEGYMELVQETAQQRTAQTTKNIAKQTASTGLRPDGSSAKRLNLNKNPEDMTDEELDAVLASGGLATKKRR